MQRVNTKTYAIFGGSGYIQPPKRKPTSASQPDQCRRDAVFVKLGGKGAGSFLNITGADLGGSAWTGFLVRKVRFCSFMI